MKLRILSHFISFALMTVIMTSMLMLGIGSLYLFATIIVWELIPIQLESFLLFLRISFAIGMFIGLGFACSKQGLEIAKEFRKSFLKTYRGE